MLMIELTALIASAAGVMADRTTARRETGRATGRRPCVDVFAAWSRHTAADARVIDDPLHLPQPGAVVEVPRRETGSFTDVDAQQIGRWVLPLGGGVPPPMM